MTEYELIVKYKLENDIEARNKVIEMNMGYIQYLASRYHGAMYDDLVQEGMIELIKSVDRYDINFNLKLIKFAQIALSGALNRYFLKNMEVVSKYTTKGLQKLKRNKSLYQFDGSDDDTIMKEMNVSKKELQHFKAMQTLVYLDDDDNDNVQLSGNNMDNPLEVLMFKEKTDKILKIQKAINELDARSRDIVMGRCMGDKVLHTLDYYSKKYGISGERVRQLEHNSVKRITNMVASW